MNLKKEAVGAHGNNGSDIVLASINARYSHAAPGPRSLLANLGELRPQAVLQEFIIQDLPQRIVERILAERPRIVGLSLAIWNISVAKKVMALLKALEPKLPIVVGGPEVRWAETPPNNSDVLVRGEGETAFPEICRKLLAGEPVPPVVDGGEPDLTNILLPYDEYSDTDLKQRIIYVETGRGCPFRCEFCLSSREPKVRAFEPARILSAFDSLLERGCRSFKFVDRTFNLDLKTCQDFLDFFYERWPRDDSGDLAAPRLSRQVGQGSDRNDSLFLHFEVVPDRFDDRLVSSLARFPEGGIQLEMGIQTLNPEAGARISRRVDAETAARNIAALKEKTGVHIHADLIFGLPGEDLDDMARSFNALRKMDPHEIQLGILKLLPGAPIARHTDEFSMVYNPEPPYDILKTDRVSFDQMQDLKRLARYYDIFANSGKFSGAMNLIMDTVPSAFTAFADLASWLWSVLGRDHAVAQAKQYELILMYLTERMGMDETQAGSLLTNDYLRQGNERYMPEKLRPFMK